MPSGSIIGTILTRPSNSLAAAAAAALLSSAATRSRRASGALRVKSGDGVVVLFVVFFVVVVVVLVTVFVFGFPGPGSTVASSTTVTVDSSCRSSRLRLLERLFICRRFLDSSLLRVSCSDSSVATFSETEVTEPCVSVVVPSSRVTSRL